VAVLQANRPLRGEGAAGNHLWGHLQSSQTWIWQAQPAVRHTATSGERPPDYRGWDFGEAQILSRLPPR